MKELTILGSTGSIGTQTLDVAARQGMHVRAIAAGRNYRLAEEQARIFHPDIVAMADVSSARELKIRLADTSVRVFSGPDGVCEVAAGGRNSICVASIVGTAGLAPVLCAIDSGSDIALANKETLVCAGNIVKKHAKENGVKIIPVDSEHSAIYRCIGRAPEDRPSRITLTASGGAFWGKTVDEMKNVTVSDAMRNPNWNMGPKVTVDSASLVNKGLELMEAVQLFDLPSEKIDILIHPQSIIHSLIEFSDGAMLAQLGVPDMRAPISYALNGKGNCDSGVRRLKLSDYAGLTFFEPDDTVYPALKWARICAAEGENAPTVFNAVSETATNAFINGEIRFSQMAEVIGICVETIKVKRQNSLDEVLENDRLAREEACRTIDRLSKR